MRDYQSTVAFTQKHIMREIDRMLESEGILIKLGQHNAINEQINRLLLSLVSKK